MMIPNKQVRHIMLIMVMFGLCVIYRTQVTRESQMHLLAFLAFAISVTSASVVAADLSASESPEYQAYFTEVCKDSNDGNICQGAEWLAWKWRETIMVTVATLATYPNTLLLALRMEMWSPVFMDALTKAAHAQWLKRYENPHEGSDNICFMLP